MPSERFGCPACIPEVPVHESRADLKHLARLVDESHLGISIYRCAACGQEFISIFAELIDWANGEDPQCTTLMPLTQDEAARMIAAGENLDLAELTALGRERRFLRDDWPGTGIRTLEYTTGQVVGPHD